MNKKEYSNFIYEIQDMIFNFVNDYRITSACKLPIAKDDDIQWTLNLGDIFGNVNIIIESWKRANYKGKVNVCSIPMRYDTYRDDENLFSFRSGHVNTFNGKFVLNARSNASESLKNDFRAILDIWSMTQVKDMTEKPICMN